MAVLLVAAAVGCAPLPLLERAIRARGGPLRAVVQQGEATMRQGLPGTWQWRTVFLVPDRFALTIITANEANHYLFDGQAVRAFVGERVVALDPSRDAPLRTHARFTAVMNLDALRLPAYRIAPLAPEKLLPGATEGLDVLEAAAGARYRLGFDGHGLLAWAIGPLDVWPFGKGEVMARFTDFRRVDGLLLPFETVYAFQDRVVLEQRVFAACLGAPDLREESFHGPAELPDCHG